MKLESTDDDEDQQERDLEEHAAINSQLYVCALLAKEYDEAIRTMDSSIEATAKVYGPKSRKLSSKYF